MLILSQNKRWMIVVENVKALAENWSQPERHEIWAQYDCEPVSDECILLGEYSTREKAMEVMEMIAERYRALKAPFAISTRIPDPIFEMPQDEEVEA